MSLDVYLKMPGVTIRRTEPAIFIRESGQRKEISREEWDRRNPGREPVVVLPSEEGTDTVYSGNVTHNLNQMADAAEIYDHLWRPDEIGITHAQQLIEPLQKGLFLLCSDPQQYQQYNPENGWGNYEGLVEFVEEYLAACKRYPEAEVLVWT